MKVNSMLSNWKINFVSAVVSWNWDHIHSLPLSIEKRSTSPRWETPCSRGPSLTSDTLPPMAITVEQALREMSVKSTLQKEAAIVLKKNYVCLFFIPYLQTFFYNFCSVYFWCTSKELFSRLIIFKFTVAYL